jgi:hypothetical protein
MSKDIGRILRDTALPTFQDHTYDYTETRHRLRFPRGAS